MKTNTFKLVIAFCSVSFAVNAQIKLTSDNKIGIGTTTPSTDVEIYAGTTKFNRTINGGQTVVPVMIDWQYNHPRIYPNTSHTGYFGNPCVWYSGSFDYVLYYVSCTHVSDAKFKKNIVPLNQSLDKILQLNGVRYELDFSTLGIKTKEDEPFGKIQMGLVAQDVIKILPEVVQ